MTKVLILTQPRSQKIAAFLALAALLVQPALSHTVETPESHPAEALYLQLGQVGLDPSRVYQVRGASLDRSSVHITLEDGTIAFTRDVMGRITGAFFEGDGEILLVPPNAAERQSMSLFTGMAILEERFATAYFRFNDETAAEMRPDLRSTENAQEFVAQWNETARNLAHAAAMRLLVSFSRKLPVTGAPSQALPETGPPSQDRMLFARLQGKNLGVFDVFYDSTAAEQIQVGQSRTLGGTTYYDVWTAFSQPLPLAPAAAQSSRSPAGISTDDSFVIHRFAIKTVVQPPRYIEAEANLDLEIRRGGERTLLFELSRFLNVTHVDLDGESAEFIHNPSVEGTQLSRRGNDLVAVVLPQPAVAGQKCRLRFTYGGEVLAEAGSGLLYVGERGTWYPNRGLAPADFDLEFRYPPGWTLLATGKAARVSSAPTVDTHGEQVAHWVSDRPIPVAGFNLGKYRFATAQAGDVTVEAYATGGVERDFPSAPPQVITAAPGEAPDQRRFQVIVPAKPSPASNVSLTADRAARAIQYYSRLFGPFPYSRLALTQMPGPESQGWPELVFLSSYAFLNASERKQLHFDDTAALLQEQIPAHEAAHQWWGDLITWKTYRDQWFSEGLANYSSLMMLQEKNPAGFRQIMDRYRHDLVEKTKDGALPKDAGAVTLGARLLSSHFPRGYEAVMYGRGTWMFHMLRTMLQDSSPKPADGKAGRSEEPFVRSLRKLRQRYEGKAITTRQLLDVFAEDLPPSLQFEGKKSLDWFLDGWINGTALPKLGLTGIKYTPKGASTLVTGTILQKQAPEDLVTSVPVYAVVAGKQMVLLGRVFADGKDTSFHLMAPAGTHKILLDPHETILTSPN